MDKYIISKLRVCVFASLLLTVPSLAEQSSSSQSFRYRFLYQTVGSSPPSKVSARLTVKTKPHEEGATKWICTVNKVDGSKSMRKAVKKNLSEISVTFQINLSKKGEVIHVDYPSSSETKDYREFAVFLVQNPLLLLFLDMNNILHNSTKTWEMVYPLEGLFGEGPKSDLFSRGYQRNWTFRCRTVDEINLEDVGTCEVIIGKASGEPRGDQKLIVYYNKKDGRPERVKRLDFNSDYVNEFVLERLPTSTSGRP